MCTATMRIRSCTEMHLLQQLRMWGQHGALGQCQTCTVRQGLHTWLYVEGTLKPTLCVARCGPE
jgi:hypothetical protein